MKRLLPWLLPLCLCLACKKDSCDDDPDKPPVAVITDRQSILLKDVTVSSLPPPYYFLTYNDSAYITTVDFASGFFRMSYHYRNGRIDSALNIFSGSYMRYRYTDQYITRVEEYSPLHLLEKIVYIVYDNKKRISVMRWEIQRPPSPPLTERLVEMEYYDNDNLRQMRSQHVDPTTEILGISSITTYNAYDTRRNPEQLFVFKGAFTERVILLPTAIFQRNNPLNVDIANRLGPTLHVDYTYTYQDTLPVQVQSNIRILAGIDSGKTFTGLTSYSYYR